MKDKSNDDGRNWGQFELKLLKARMRRGSKGEGDQN